MMTKREKLYFLLDAINDARAITPSGQPILIDPTNDLNRKYRGVELDQLFTKLTKDEKVFKVLQNPNRVRNAILQASGQYRDMDDGCYHIELLPSFDGYFLKIQHESEYFEFTGKKPSTETIQEQKIGQVEKIANDFTPENYPFVLMVLKRIASLTEFSTDNEVNYKLQSPSGQAIIQERALLKKFEARGLFKHLGEDGVFGIATLGDVNTSLIRQIIAEIEERESGVIPEDKFEEIKKQYNQSKPRQGFNKLFSTAITNLQSSDLPTPINQANDKILECGLLKINLDQSTIQFKDTSPAEISTGVNTIKFLIILMENKRVVEYTEIAQKLKLNCYHEGSTNKDVAREVQFLRRDLSGFLVKIGMNRTEVQGMFISKKNVGYKLRCSS